MNCNSITATSTLQKGKSIFCMFNNLESELSPYTEGEVRDVLNSGCSCYHLPLLLLINCSLTDCTFKDLMFDVPILF